MRRDDATALFKMELYELEEKICKFCTRWGRNNLYKVIAEIVNVMRKQVEAFLNQCTEINLFNPRWSCQAKKTYKGLVEVFVALQILLKELCTQSVNTHKHTFRLTLMKVKFISRWSVKFGDTNTLF